MSNVPAKLGRYHIVKHLANGGMAQVLIARAGGIEGFERHVVVKRIHSERAEDPAFVKMFLDEARLAAKLHHHNIVQVYDIGKENGEYFFAMEYVHGEDLRKLLTTVNRRKEKVPLAQVLTIVTSAASALHCAHEHLGPDRKPLGIVHRDVSPANILVGFDGNVKVVDFGIAKAATLQGREATKAGSLKGKVAYMAPEQLAGDVVDRRGDIFALGIVLYELTTVRRLFKADTEFLTMSAIMSGKIPLPTQNRPDCPKGLEEIILKALATKPQDRYQTAEEMREALEELAAKEHLHTSTGALASYMKQLFGRPPEPWLVEEEAEILEILSVDFDDPASSSGEHGAKSDLHAPLGKKPVGTGRTTGSLAAPVPRAATAPPVATGKPVRASSDKPVRPGTEPPVRATTEKPARATTDPPVRNTPPPTPAARLGRATPVGGVPTIAAPVAHIPPVFDDGFAEPPRPPISEAASAPAALSSVPKADGTASAAELATAASDSQPKTDRPAEESSTSWEGRSSTGGTPMAWSSAPTAARPSRRRPFAIVAGIALVGTLLFVLLSGKGSERSAAPAAQPAKHEPARPEPTPEPMPAVTTDASVEAAEGSSAGSSTETTTDKSGSAAGSAAGSGADPTKKKKKKKKEAWNPDELFVP